MKTPSRLRGRDTVEHLGELLRYHEVLLLDRVRNNAFRRALAATVRPGHRVLDVGTGSGVWAVTAAKLGARQVVAVEREELLAPVIRRVIADSGVADRVELIVGEFRDLRLRREFDVVVSETVGNFAFDEDVVSILSTARERCLVRGGALLPQSIGFLAAPVRRRAAVPQPASLPVSLRAFREVSSMFPRGASWAEITLAAPPREMARLDFAVGEAGRTGLGRVQARWRLARPQAIDAIVAWIRLDLSPGVSVDTRRCHNWYPTLFPIDPVRARGTVEFVLDHDHERRTRRWRVTLDGADGRVTREFCPELAFGAVQAAARRALATKTPPRRTIER